MAGFADVVIAGGAESMSRAPYVMLKSEKAFDRAPEIADTTLGNRLLNPELIAQYPPISLGETAENVAERFNVSREDQDAFALRSQHRAAAAMREGRFAPELVPVRVTRGKTAHEVRVDEHPRQDITADDLGRLKPAFKAGGTVTAGNSSGLNDGASALLMMSGPTAEAMGMRPLARVVATAVYGVDPSIMGIGPIGATQRILQRTGMTIDEIDLVELNEAFAAQAVAVMRELNLDPETTNVNGGAIALGHPLGCSGARITTTLLHEMRRRGSRYGLATMCIGMGQGIATLYERV
jgi:acetyl-CoA acetyltransferase family protein